MRTSLLVGFDWPSNPIRLDEEATLDLTIQSRRHPHTTTWDTVIECVPPHSIDAVLDQISTSNAQHGWTKFRSIPRGPQWKPTSETPTFST